MTAKRPTKELARPCYYSSGPTVGGASSEGAPYAFLSAYCTGRTGGRPAIAASSIGLCAASAARGMAHGHVHAQSVGGAGRGSFSHLWDGATRGADGRDRSGSRGRCSRRWDGRVGRYSVAAGSAAVSLGRRLACYTRSHVCVAVCASPT